MKPVRLVLPEPPSVNRMWRKGARGTIYSAKETTAFKHAVYAACLKAGITAVRFPKGTPVVLTLHWYRARAAGDIDNRIKVASDALNGLVWADDKQVGELHVYRIDGQRPGRLEVTVERAA